MVHPIDAEASAEDANIIAENQEMTSRITEALRIIEDPFGDVDNLTDPVREVLTLASLGMTAGDISEKTVKSKSAIGALMMRGLARLNLQKSDLPQYVIQRIENTLRG